jgi:DNA-directed RNA polymerase specialized sigma24 family protein
MVKNKRHSNWRIAGEEINQAEALYRDNLEEIDRIIRFVCRRLQFFGQAAEDFTSSVHLKLLQDDYHVFRKFRGDSQLGTYLVLVITNQGRDFRIQKWGKWRPSAAAKRFGPLAVMLETLLYGERFPYSEAVQQLVPSGACGVCRVNSMNSQ